MRSDHLIDLPSAVRRQVLVKRPFKDDLMLVMAMDSDNAPTNVIRVQYDRCDLLYVWHMALNELGRRYIMIRQVRVPRFTSHERHQGELRRIYNYFFVKNF